MRRGFDKRKGWRVGWDSAISRVVGSASLSSSIARPARRARPAYGGLIVLTILLGLASRRFGASLPGVVREYAGDTLWAAMVYFLAALVWPRASTLRLAVGSLLFAVAIEVSQLYHAPWIDAVRATRPGALVLGFGFLWSDLVCYAAGVGLAALVDQLLVRGRTD